METNISNVARSGGRLALDRVLTDLKTLSRDAQEFMRATAEVAGEKGRGARERLAQTLEQATATLTELQQQTRFSLKDTATKADTAVRDHPYHSVGIAFGIGLLLGVLVTRD